MGHFQTGVGGVAPSVKPVKLRRNSDVAAPLAGVRVRSIANPRQSEIAWKSAGNQIKQA